MTTERFRTSTWESFFEEPFEEKLRGSGRKEQYLSIQASTLADSLPDVARGVPLKAAQYLRRLAARRRGDKPNLGSPGRPLVPSGELAHNLAGLLLANRQARGRGFFAAGPGSTNARPVMPDLATASSSLALPASVT